MKYWLIEKKERGINVVDYKIPDNSIRNYRDYFYDINNVTKYS